RREKQSREPPVLEKTRRHKCSRIGAKTLDQRKSSAHLFFEFGVVDVLIIHQGIDRSIASNLHQTIYLLRRISETGPCHQVCRCVVIPNHIEPSYFYNVLEARQLPLSAVARKSTNPERPVMRQNSTHCNTGYSVRNRMTPGYAAAP